MTADRSVPRRIATGILAACAVVAPLFLGATPPRAQVAMHSATAVVVLLCAWSGAPSRRSLLWPVLIAAVAAMQLVPLPDAILMRLTPISAAYWKASHPTPGTAWGTISIDPRATTSAICVLLLAVATAVAVGDLARNASNRAWLAGALALSGAAIWTLGLVFPVDRENRILLGMIDLKGAIVWWKTTLCPPVQTAGWGYPEWVTVGGQRYESDGSLIGDGFGPYIYSNHFAGALILTVPSIMGFWLWWSRHRVWPSVRAGVALACGAAALGTIGFLVKSRAGALSFMLACLVFASLVVRARRPRRVLGILTIACAGMIVCALATLLIPIRGWEGVLPAPWARIVEQLWNDPRVLASHVATRMFAASPLLGTGIGSYGDLFPRVARAKYVLYYAHNDYAQLLAETGLVGGAVACVIAGLLLLRLRRFWLDDAAANQPLSAAAWASLAGIAVHSALDWNIHVPANAFLAALVAGLCLGSVDSQSRPAAVGKQGQGFLAPAILGVACAVAVAGLARDAVSTTVEGQLRKAVTAARLAEDGRGTGSEVTQLDDAITVGERMATRDRGNSRLAMLIGQAILHRAELARSAGGAVDAADVWFRRARTACAACRGLPEVRPLPPSERR